MNDWTVLQRAVENSRREANARVGARRILMRDRVRELREMLLGLPEAVAQQNTSAAGTFITEPADWLGQDDS